MSTLSTFPSQEDAAKLKLEDNNLVQGQENKAAAAATKYRQAIAQDPSCSVYYTNLCATLNHLKLYVEMHTVASVINPIGSFLVKGFI